jgi:hypothetical protein
MAMPHMRELKRSKGDWMKDRERWPDVSRAEWKEMRAEIIEEIEAWGF